MNQIFRPTQTKRIVIIIPFAMIFSLMIIFFMRCREVIEVETPIQFTEYMVGEQQYVTRTDFKALRFLQMQSYYAVIKVKEFHVSRTEQWTQKEWFKKPDKLRREVISPRAFPQVYINDGKNSWDLTLAPQYAQQNEIGYKPVFYVFEISKESLNKIRQNQRVLELDEEFVIEEQFIENDFQTLTKIWLDKTTLLPVKWEQRTFNPESDLLLERSCKEIMYNVTFQKKLFCLPKGIEIKK